VLRIALREDCEPELYATCVEVFINTVECSSDVSLLMGLVAVKARTDKGMLGIPVSLMKRLVTRLDHVIANGGDSGELVANDLYKAMPPSDQLGAEAVDVATTLKRLLGMCRQLENRSTSKSFLERLSK
jgi:hypothetical protein